MKHFLVTTAIRTTAGSEESAQAAQAKARSERGVMQMRTRFQECRLAAAISLLLLSTAAGAAENEKIGDQNRLLNNSAVTNKVASLEKNLASIDQLKGELAHLWDIETLRSEPLKPEIVYTESNKHRYPGYKIEGIYVNGAKGEAGTDRIFFYYSRPKNARGETAGLCRVDGRGRR